MKLRDRVAQLEADLATANAALANFDESVHAAAMDMLDALIADPAALRNAILENASLAHSPRDLMAALRALDTVDHT